MLTDYSALQVFLLFTFLSTLFPLLAGGWYFKKLKPKYRILLLLCLITFVMDGASTAFWLQKKNNIFLSNFHTIFQFSLISYVYHFELKRFLPKNLILWIGLVFLLISGVNMFVGQGFWLMNTYSKTLESIIVIIYALLCFYQFANELKVESITRDPMFWFSSGNLIYFSSNIFIFVLSNFFLDYSEDFYVKIWIIHAVFYIIFQIICMVTLWLSSKK